MPSKHVDDALLKRAVASYLNQIGGQFKADGASDCGVIVIIARPDGAGGFIVHGAGTIDGRQMDGPTQRKMLAVLHNESNVIISDPVKA